MAYRGTSQNVFKKMKNIKTAVGRYYYPCYLIARDIYNNRKGRKPGSKISHEELIKYFEGLDGGDAKIGDELRILRDIRN